MEDLVKRVKQLECELSNMCDMEGKAVDANVGLRVENAKLLEENFALKQRNELLEGMYEDMQQAAQQVVTLTKSL